MVGYLPGRRGWAKRRTRKAFLSATSALLKKKTFADISVVDICEKAGIPRATFYNYFEDKYGLIKEAAAELVERINAAKFADDAPMASVVTDLMDILLQFFYLQREFITPFLLVGGFVTDAVTEALSDRFYERNRDTFASELMASAAVSAIRWWTLSGCVMQPEYMEKRLLSLLKVVSE